MPPPDLSVISQPPPQRLFHYTSQKGVVGILDSAEIWATKIQYLNDESEFRHGLDLARSQMGLLGDPDAPGMAGFSKLVEQAFDGIRRVNVFVSSWSEARDLLSQWRAYSATGQGFNIGVDGAALLRVASRVDFVLGKCVYEFHQQAELVRELTRSHWGRIKESAAKGAALDPKREARSYAHSLGGLIPFLKHWGYSEEREWRLVSRLRRSDDPAIAVRHGEHCLVPYFRIPLIWDSGSIGDIHLMVGPGPMSDHDDGLAILMRRSKLHTATQGYSQTPLRRV